MVFHFSNADDSSADDPPSEPGTPGPGAPRPNGVGGWIERMNNVQSRSTVPQAKRRKTEDGQDFAAMANDIPVRGGSGVLGDYVKDKRKEADGSGLQQTFTVDLTGGKLCPSGRLW